MRKAVATIAIIAFTCALLIRLRALFLGPSPVTLWLWLAWHRVTRKMTGGPAPQFNCDVPKENLLRNSYSVILKSGYSFAQHKQAVGRSVELDAVTEEVLDHPFPGFQITYYAKIEDPSLLDSVRADPGVEFVECDVLEDFSMGIPVNEAGEPLQ